MKSLLFLLVFTVAVPPSLHASPACKADLIDEMTKETGKDREELKNVVDSFLEKIIQHLANGESVALKNFGTFSVTERAERSARNPQTGEMLVIKASKRPKFKAGKTFVDAVNKQDKPEE